MKRERREGKDGLALLEPGAESSDSSYPSLTTPTQNRSSQGASCKEPVDIGDKCRRSDLRKLPDELGRLRPETHSEHLGSSPT